MLWYLVSFFHATWLQTYWISCWTVSRSQCVTILNPMILLYVSCFQCDVFSYYFSSLNTEAYDHISATYFLLAEKRLRLQHDERLKALGGPSIFGLCSPTGAVSGSQGSGLQPSNPPVVNGTTGGLVGLQCQGRRSPLLYTPIQVNAGQTTVGAAGSQFPQQQQSTPYNITQVPAPNSPMQQMGQVSQVGVAAQLSNRSGNGSADISIISNAAQMLAPGTGRPSNSINTTTGTGGMQLPLSNRSARSVSNFHIMLWILL